MPTFIRILSLGYKNFPKIPLSSPSLNNRINFDPSKFQVFRKMSTSTPNLSTTASEPHTIQKEYRCYSESTRFQCDYTWTIQNFKFYVCERQRNMIKSPTFSATEDTCKWFLELYTPFEKSSVTELYLKTSSNTAELDNFGPITGELRCSIVNSDGQKTETREKDIFFNSISSFSNFWLFSGRDIFNDEKLFPGGELTIHCTICYIHQKSVHHVTDLCNLKNASLPNPMEPMERLFNNQELSDVTIYVGDGKYPVHKVILATRSSVFNAMFNHEMEKRQRIIYIDDIDEIIFQEVLRYIYTGKVEDIETMVFDLLFAADKYDLAGLKMMCENQLLRMLALDTAVKILSFSNTYNLSNLKTRAIQYVKTNLTKITDSEAWNDLISQPELMKAVLQA